jgi:hypothetical protein
MRLSIVTRSKSATTVFAGGPNCGGAAVPE